MGLDFIDFAPRFSSKQAERIAGELYEIEACACSLPSERDQNFLLEEKYTGTRYVLKISNQREKKEFLELQNISMKKIRDSLSDSVCPQVCLDSRGEEIARIENREGNCYFVRLVTYIEGRPLGKVSPHTPYLLGSAGRLLARIDLALKELSHPAAKRNFYWDLQNGPDTVQNLFRYINNPDKQSLISYFLDKFYTDASGIVLSLEKSIIHNDGNDHNILVNRIEQNNPNSSLLRVSGIIDFGDMVYSYTIGDIAIASAYVMLGKEDFQKAAFHMIKGYQEIIKLSERELQAIFHLIYMRLCLSVSISAFQKRQNPDNKYLIISEKRAWKLLQEIKKKEMTPSLFYE